MVPYTQIDVHAPFSAAFLHLGMTWAAKLVSIGALLGELHQQRLLGGGMLLGLGSLDQQTALPAALWGASLCSLLSNHCSMSLLPAVPRHPDLNHDWPAEPGAAVCGAGPAAPATCLAGPRQPAARHPCASHNRDSGLCRWARRVGLRDGQPCNVPCGSVAQESSWLLGTPARPHLVKPLSSHFSLPSLPLLCRPAGAGAGHKLAG